MIRVPVEVQVMIPHDVLYPPMLAPALPGQAEPAPYVGLTASDPNAYGCARSTRTTRG